MKKKLIISMLSTIAFGCSPKETSVERLKNDECDSLEIFSWCYVFPKNNDTTGYSMCKTYSNKSYLDLITQVNRKTCIKDKVIIENLYAGVFNLYKDIDTTNNYIPNARFVFLNHSKKGNDTLVLINGRSIFNVNSRTISNYDFNLFNELKKFEFYNKLQSDFSK
jgi:hypothetical protein